MGSPWKQGLLLRGPWKEIPGFHGDRTRVRLSPGCGVMETSRSTPLKIPSPRKGGTWSCPRGPGSTLLQVPAPGKAPSSCFIPRSCKSDLWALCGQAPAGWPCHPPLMLRGRPCPLRGCPEQACPIPACLSRRWCSYHAAAVVEESPLWSSIFSPSPAPSAPGPPRCPGSPAGASQRGGARRPGLTLICHSGKGVGRRQVLP